MKISSLYLTIIPHHCNRIFLQKVAKSPPGIAARRALVYSLLCLGLGLCLSLGFRLCCGSSSGSGGLHHGLRGIGVILQREQDDVLGALLGAHTAALALVVINACHAVHNMDGVELTGALAHAAGNAGGGAQLVCHSTLILVGAHDHRLAGAGSIDHDHLLGADVGAGTTAGALVLVHLGNTVHNVDGIELTHLGAVTQTNTGKGAGLGAAVQCSSGCTGLDALVIISRLAVLGIALTLDNQVGRAADAIKIFSDAKIGITYMYSFLLGDKGILIFRTDNPDSAREVIILNNLSFVADKDLSSLI